MHFVSSFMVVCFRCVMGYVADFRSVIVVVLCG